MKKITILTLAFVSTLLLGSVSADEKVDEEISRFVETYIETFNKRKPLKSFFHFPNVWLVGDSVEPEILTDSSVPIVNYENLVKTGWSHSNINELKIINANTSRAFAIIDFSRIDKNGKEILRSKTMYTIAKKNDKWGLVLIASLTPFVKGTE